MQEQSFTSLREELTIASSLVFEAGKKIRSIYQTHFSVQWKAENDPLTEADLVANDIITAGLVRHFPNDSILSEEAKDNPDRLKNDRVWILDPIDGTREFVKKNPEFAVSLGLSVKGKPTLGLVFNPIKEEIFLGIVGLGISRDGKDFSKLDFSNTIKKPSLVVSKSENSKGLFSSQEWTEEFSITEVGSIAYKLALVAIDQFDLIISRKPKNEWDICAGVALVLSAGGKVFDLNELKEISFNEETIRKNGIIAGNPFIVEKLITEKKEFLQNSYIDTWNYS
ncbi:MAG: 3'(2'),5'-bisphosphate nucleotidase CysQ [Leptospiraceae bacterium]|nr:3'(2'),5'-bisphosphate nucleotidase CysQ [Leptospiraceae bacterium]